MSLKNYKPKTKKAPWTRTPSGKRLLASAAARKQKSDDKRKAERSSKSFAQQFLSGVEEKFGKPFKTIRSETLAHPGKSLARLTNCRPSLETYLFRATF
jgi:hypothetical protein